MAGAPAITGFVQRGMTNWEEMVSGTMGGSLYCGAPLMYAGHTTGDWNRPTLHLDASRSSSIYGNSTTITPLSRAVMFMIRF